MKPIPVSRYLVPATAIAAPEGFTTTTAVIQAGLPHPIPVDQATRFLVVVPTGLASIWQDLDPTTVISTSQFELDAAAEPVHPAPLGWAAAVHPQLQVQSGGVTVACMPLTAGLRRTLPDGGSAGARFEIVVLSWILHSGSMRGAGDFGSRVVIAYRRADQAVARFSTPPPHPILVQRLPLEFKMQSLIGFVDAGVKLLDPQLRYRNKKVFVR